MKKPQLTNQIMFPDISKEIIDMVKIDQKMRSRATEEPGFWDYSIDKKIQKE